MRLRRLACAVFVAAALAACAGAAQQDATATDKPPRKVGTLTTGGPLPPERVIDLRCKVDADCATKEACADVACRCVRDKCVRMAPAVDPVVDPAPTPPPER